MFEMKMHFIPSKLHHVFLFPVVLYLHPLLYWVFFLFGHYHRSFFLLILTFYGGDQFPDKATIGTSFCNSLLAMLVRLLSCFGSFSARNFFMISTHCLIYHALLHLFVDGAHIDGGGAAVPINISLLSMLLLFFNFCFFIYISCPPL